jgi:predicted N-acyltransferase
VRIAPGADAVEAIALVEREVTRFARERGAAWSAFKEFGAADMPAARAALRGRGYVLAPGESNCRLDLRWSRYEEFLAALRSPYRRAIRLAGRRFEEARASADAVPLAGAYGPELHALYDAVRARAGIGLEWLTPAYFRALGVAFGEDAVLLRFRRDGRTIGWVALLVAGDAVVDLFHGIDYAENGASSLYFNQLAEVVRFAIARRAAYVSLGQSTLTAKTRFGGVPMPLWFAVRHRNAAVRALLAAGRPALFPAPAPIGRRVFTAAPANGATPADGRERAA